MNADAKKTVLRMIPYGIYVLTADDGNGGVAAATVNFVTQTAFAPPLLVVGVKTNSGAYAVVKHAGKFALNMLGKDAKGLAFTFFKPAKLEDGKLSGQSFQPRHQQCPHPGHGDRRDRVPGEEHRRARRPPHRGCGSYRGAPAETDHRPPGCCDTGNERPRRQRLLRRLRPTLEGGDR